MASFALAAFALSAPPGGAEPFRGSAEPIDSQLRQRMTGVSWHPGCPVGFGRLRLLGVNHWGVDREVHRGRLVVHRDSAGAMLRTLRELYRLRFPIRRMRLVDAYGADDHRSMAADNTSAFNCRTVAGTSRWSSATRSTSTRSRTPTSPPRATSRRRPAPPTPTARGSGRG
jgi:hypothetical protein